MYVNMHVPVHVCEEELPHFIWPICYMYDKLHVDCGDFQPYGAVHVY